MFVIVVKYKKTVDEINPFLADHREFLERYISNGMFLFSGPQHIQKGGVIISRGHDAEHLRSILMLDPFFENDLAEYEVLEFSASKMIPELEGYLD